MRWIALCLSGGVAIAVLCGLKWISISHSHRDRLRTISSEKRGRIVDDRTSAGLADVLVIANLNSSHLGWNPSSTCETQFVLKTDSDGYYVVPDISESIYSRETTLRTYREELHFSWHIYVYKAGYIRTPDAIVAPTPGDIVPVGHEAVYPSWRTNLVDESQNGSALLPELRMRPPDAEPITAFKYYASLAGQPMCRNVEPIELRDMWQQTKADAVKLICKMAGSDEIHGTALRDYLRVTGQLTLPVDREQGDPGTPELVYTAGYQCHKSNYGKQQ
ncbi:MAG: hypothetical protein ABIQ70_12745 [Dokdonella sp.]